MASSSPSEHEIQQRNRLACGRGPVRLWRNNTGALVDQQGRFVRFGLCKGSSDLIGLRSVVVTPEMVGQCIAQFVALEIKTDSGAVSPEQKAFLQLVRQLGGLGAVCRSIEQAQAVLELPQAAGWMLSMLLGIPLAKQAWPSEPPGQHPAELADVTVAADAAQPSPASHEQSAPAADLDVALEPLTPQAIEATHQRILALPQASRQALTKAFREHFQVPRNARSIGDRITQRQHSDFIELFLAEAQGQVQAEAPAEPGRGNAATPAEP